ncbi:MAG: hypothetical protein BWY57_02646 [Betaproteobacteria bacterium ADurb.Bin341]|nr:MAG: hypothetical protein BWY57_02646 [Betaproteobacteria bacterium ADurb.Bin341]
MKKILLTLLFSGLAASAQATVFKCVVEDGSEVFSNRRIGKSCKVIVIDSDNVLPSPASKQANAAKTPSPAGFPKVSEDEQKSRDKDRKFTLEQELATEQKDLERAKKDLSDQEALRPKSESAQNTSERLQPYRERVARHERNIAAINKELVNLK